MINLRGQVEQLLAKKISAHVIIMTVLHSTQVIRETYSDLNYVAALQVLTFRGMYVVRKYRIR